MNEHTNGMWELAHPNKVILCTHNRLTMCYILHVTFNCGVYSSIAWHTCMGMSDAMLPMQGGTEDSDDDW